jgi:glutathione S-transferase
VSAILYRCPAPTDWLCTCGRVARELRKHGIAYEEVRTAWRPRDRPEVRAISGGNQLVPVLVIDGEPIADHKRIVENLRFRAGD